MRASNDVGRDAKTQPATTDGTVDTSSAKPAVARPRPRLAIVLFNLGGPDRPEAIRPFLVNLFSDPAILRVPFFVRPFLARRIAAARLAPARASYATLGGRSPLLELTRAQAAALEAEMTELDAKCFVAMRYWHPLSDETVRAVRDWRPDEVVLLPLYPQHSCTTTGSVPAARASSRGKFIGSTPSTSRPGCRARQSSMYPRGSRATAVSVSRVVATVDSLRLRQLSHKKCKTNGAGACPHI